MAIKTPPPFLKSSAPNGAESKRITKHNGNWTLLFNSLLKGNENPDFVLKVMWVEVHRQHPREGVLRRLLSRYNALSRKSKEAALEMFIKKNPQIKYSVTSEYH